MKKKLGGVVEGGDHIVFMRVLFEKQYFIKCNLNCRQRATQT